MAFCFRAADDGGAGKLIKIGGGGDTSVPVRVRPKKPVKANPDALETLPDAQLDRGYRAFCSELGLSEAHRAALAARGLTGDLLAAGYRTFDYRGEWPRINRAVDAARVELGGQVKDLPLVNKPNLVVAGLLIPVRNGLGQVVGLRLRPDDAAGGGKYRWGKGARARCHVVVPLLLKDDALWITEGELKADLSAQRLGVRVISMPGVSSGHDEAVATAKVLGAQHVVVAFDADLATNVQVERARDRLVSKLQSEGLKVSLATWPLERGKGLDDLLVAGRSPTVSPVTQQVEMFAGKGGPAKKRQAADKALLLAAADLDSTPYETAQRLRRAARCGDWATSKLCANCRGKLGKITIEAENALCPHCSAAYLKSLFTALSTSTKHLPEWTAIGVVKFDDDSPKGVAKNLREVKGWLRRADKGLEQRLRFIRSPGVILFYGDQSEAGLIHRALGRVQVLDRVDAAKAIVAVIEKRHRRVLRHFEAGDAAGLAAEEWAKRFVCTSVGKVAKKSLPWPNLKEMRDLVRESKKNPNDPPPDEDFDPSVSKCCGAAVVHVLCHHGKEVARRTGGRPYLRNESERFAEKIE